MCVLYGRLANRSVDYQQSLTDGIYICAHIIIYVISIYGYSVHIESK